MTIADVQRVRKVVLGLVILGGVALFALGTCAYEHAQSPHAIIKWMGVLALVICIFGRTWCALYIGGRKIEQLVTSGPYSVSRNPLYFFSILGAIGAGAQFGSIVSGSVFGILTWAVFRLVVWQEEQILLQRHGATFESYAASVPRFLPKARLWRDSSVLTVRPRNVVTTFGDGILLMLFVPLSELFEHLQTSHVLPVLIRLP